MPLKKNLKKKKEKEKEKDTQQLARTASWLEGWKTT